MYQHIGDKPLHQLRHFSCDYMLKWPTELIEVDQQFWCIKCYVKVIALISTVYIVTSWYVRNTISWLRSRRFFLVETGPIFSYSSKFLRISTAGWEGQIELMWGDIYRVLCAILQGVGGWWRFVDYVSQKTYISGNSKQFLKLVTCCYFFLITTWVCVQTNILLHGDNT